LAGRRGELAEAAAVLTGTSGVAGLLVVGEAGVGKSRLVAVAVADAARAGVAVLTGWRGRGHVGPPAAADYGLIAEIPTIGADLPVDPGMSFSVELTCVIGDHTVNIGGTVIVGEADPVELNPFTAQLLRA